MKPRVLGGLAIGAVVALSAFALRPPPKLVSAQTGRKASASPAASRKATTGQSDLNALNAADHATEAGAAKSSVDGAAMMLTGVVTAGAQATLSVRMPSRVVAVNIQEGASVRRGQVLALLDDREARAQQTTAEAAIAAARTQVAKARLGREAQAAKSQADLDAALGGLRQAQTKARQARLARDAARSDTQSDLAGAQEGVRKADLALARARETLRELEALATVGGVSRADLEGARTQVQIAETDAQTATRQARRATEGPANNVSAPDGSSSSYRVALAQRDVEAAEAAVSQARTGVQSAQKARGTTDALAAQDIRAAHDALAQALTGREAAQIALQMTRLVSPLDGAATGVNVRAGETAQPGAPLITVVSLQSLHVEALVSARQLAGLRIGQRAQVRVDTRPGRVFAARLNEIARVSEPDGRTFHIKFRLDSSATLRPGQTAQVAIAGR